MTLTLAPPAIVTIILFATPSVSCATGNQTRQTVAAGAYCLADCYFGHLVTPANSGHYDNATQGGAIYASGGGSFSVKHCVFDSCNSTYHGGAIFTSGISLEFVESCTISCSCGVACRGSAAYWVSANATFLQCNFYGGSGASVWCGYSDAFEDCGNCCNFSQNLCSVNALICDTLKYSLLTPNKIFIN
jgi:predicted outer membrane repeat protein